MRRSWLIAVAGLLAAAAVGVGVWLNAPAYSEPGLTESTVTGLDASFEPVPVQGEQGLSLNGVVRDGAGQPVPGAEVSLAASSQQSLASLTCAHCGKPLLSCVARQSGQQVSGVLEAHQGELSAALTVRADEKGAFRFEHLSGVSFTVWARATGHGEGVVERAAPGDPVELFLPRARTLTGRLIDSAGRPVQGVVRAISRRVAHVAEAASDASGTFALEGLGEGPFYVAAQAPGKLPAVRPVVEAAGAPLTLTLLEPRRLEVELRSLGKPLDGVVTLTADHLKHQLVSHGALAAFDELYPDSVTITAQAGELSSTPQSVSLDAKVTKVTLELERGGRLLVSVADETGDAVPQPTVALLTVEGETVAQRSGAGGEPLGFGPIGPGDYRLKGSAEGFTAAEVPVTVKAGAQTAVELTLQRGTTISGRVLDEYGRPAGGVSVLISPTGESAMAQADGRFMAAVPSPGLYELHAHHSDWGGGQLKVTAPAKDVVLQLEPKAGVAVTVTAEGRRVEGANVVMYIDRQGNFRNDRPSGADGVVLMRGLPPGTYLLLASHPDFLPSERQQVTIADGQLVQVAAELKAGAAISGQVVDQVGAPVAGVALSVSPRGAEPVTSSATGEFELKPLRPNGTYRLKVIQRGYEQLSAPLAVAGGPKVKVVVKRHPVFSGRVLSSEGKPIKHFRIDDHDVDSADGRFELPLPATEERVIFSVEAPGYEPLMADRPVTPDLGDLVLKAAPSFSGVVRDEAGQPVVDAVVSCEQCQQSTLSGSDGRFSLASAPYLRSFNVTARKGKRSAMREVTGGSQDIELVLAAGTKLSGAVYQPDGTPAAGVEVQGIGADSSEAVSAVTGADGRYLLELAPGTYRFAVASPLVKAIDSLAVITQVQGESARLDFGAAPGSATLSVRVQPQRGYALWLVRGDVRSVGNPPLELLRAGYAQLIYQPLEERVSFYGLSPGRYTLVWSSFHAESSPGPLVVPVDVPAQPEVSLVR